MDKRRNVRLTKICSFVASVAFLVIVAKAETEDRIPEASGNTRTHPHKETCKRTAYQSKKRFLMLVSTLDGKLSALDVEKEGSVEWSINTGRNHLLSSSISNLEVNRDGRRTRLIPSLDGGLYQLDGRKLVSVPFNADTLLSSSFRLNDDSMMVGGKESETYGVNLHTGKLKYICDMDGCEVMETDAEEAVIQESSQTLVIKRTTKTVRAVEMESGAEKWNFSVGEHELVYINAARREPTETTPEISDQSGNTDRDVAMEDEGVRIDNCEDTDFPDESMFNFPWWNEWDAVDVKDVDFKVIVPKGLVMAVSRSDPSHVVWKHQFDTAIAKAWTLREGQLKEVDLFDARNVPALSFDGQDADAADSNVSDEDLPQAPAMYIGTHRQQLYVQPSVQMLHAVEDAINRAVMSGQTTPLEMPRVTWKPYIASSPSRTPAETRDPLRLTWERGLVDTDDSTALSIWCEYPYDVGYYAFFDTRPMPLLTHAHNSSGRCSSEDRPGDSLEDIVTDTIWKWWREILIISILSFIVPNLAIRKLFPRTPIIIVSPPPSRSNSESVGDEREGPEKAEPTTEEADKSAQQTEYQSRYAMDFEQVACLGKGGFGVVFHAKNKVDDVDYAIKRITLNNSEKAKEKVMREVKALAKLEHGHIVRYHQAWFECPPPGWQEARDRVTLPEVSFSPTPGYTQSAAPFEQSVRKCDRDLSRRGRVPRKTGRKAETVKTSDFNPLKPFEHCDFDAFPVDESTDTVSAFGGGLLDSNTASDSRKVGSTEPFSVQNITESSNLISSSDDDTSSRSDPRIQRGVAFSSYLQSKQNNAETSFEVVFSNDASGSKSGSSSLPFTHYHSDSSVTTSRDVTTHGRSNLGQGEDSVDIVFEETGSGDKGGSQHEDSNGGHVDFEPLGKSRRLTSKHQKVDEESSSDLGSTDPAPGVDLEKRLSRPSDLNLVETSPKEESNTPVEKLYLYIQMQLCKKNSLKEWLAATLEKDTLVSLDIFGQIVSAVEYVHDSGLMHRDLKPSNIFFSLDGTVKVGDFGLATALEEQAGLGGGGAVAVARAPSTAYFKKHTEQVGTELYMSPEQMEGKSYSHKVDIFALGLILFELFSDPFVTQMERINTMRKVKMRCFPAKFTRERPQQCELARNLLSPDPEDRLSAEEILNHSLLVQQELTLDQQRARSRSRSRTISQSSSNSGLSSSLPKN